MGDLLSILSQGASSLSAHQAAVATASNNLQNANTPGYARQRAELTATLPADFNGHGYIGRGVELATVSQARDKFLEQQVPAALGNEARSTAEADSLQTLSVLDPTTPGGLPVSFSQFYATMRALSQNASDPNLRQAAVSATQGLATSFNRTARAIETARAGIDAALPSNLEDANRAAADIAKLNNDINAARATGHEPNDLLDARQMSMDKLASLVGATPILDGHGSVTMVLPGGTALVSGVSASKLTAVGDGANGGHLAVYFAPADGSPARPLAANAVGGKVGGLLDARDGALKDAGTQIDQLAFDVANQVNGIHAAGFALDGTTGHDLFVVSPTVTGAAARLGVDPDVKGNPALLAAATTAAGTPGDSSNMNVLVASEDSLLSNGLDASSTVSSVISDYGASAASAKAFSQQDGAILTNVQTMRESVSGVSIDEELVNLTKSQRAYEATMKVITTADDMLNTLLQLR
jgi:flagellar hook-associated protein 1 FlgK